MSTEKKQDPKEKPESSPPQASKPKKGEELSQQDLDRVTGGVHVPQPEPG